MNERLQRLLGVWKNLPQSTKILLAGLLLVAAVSLWYVGLFLPTQTPGEAPSQATPPPALEAPPIPPLAGPEETPAPFQEEKPQAASPSAEASAPQQPTPAPLPVPQSRETPPPNPFVPLVVEAPPAPPATSAPRPTPVPSAPPVQVQARELPTPTPSPTRALPGLSGALPAPKVLTPRPQASLPPTVPEPRVAPTPPTALVETPLPQSQSPTPGETPSRTGATPLQALVAEKGLKLSGTLLGPVSVAILESKEGYLVLPAGSPIPGTEAVVRRVEADRVELALKQETLELKLPSLSQVGGEP